MEKAVLLRRLGEVDVAEKLSSRCGKEGGFTIIELMVYLTILGILAGTAVFGYSNMRNISQVNGAADQVKIAIESALETATSRGCIVTLEFDDSSDTYSVTTKETAESDEEPLKPPTAASYTQGGDGVYHVMLLDGQDDVTIDNNLTIVYTPDGVMMDITFNGASGSGSVTVSSGDKSRTISVNSMGQATY